MKTLFAFFAILLPIMLFGQKKEICTNLIVADFKCDNCELAVGYKNLASEMRDDVSSVIASSSQCKILNRDRLSSLLQLKDNEKVIASHEDLSEKQRKILRDSVLADRVLFGKIKIQIDLSCIVTLEIFNINTFSLEKSMPFVISDSELKLWSTRIPKIRKSINDGLQLETFAAERAPTPSDRENIGVNLMKKMPGTAKDIDIGFEGSVWIVGTNPVFGGYGIYKWDGSNWTMTDGGAVKIAVGPDGVPWVLNEFGFIYRRKVDTWELLPGLAKDIDIGLNGSVWVIGIDSGLGGFGIYQWYGNNWLKVPGGAVRISVDPNGMPWIVNDAGNIFRRKGNDWELMPGLGKEIDIGRDGKPWIIGIEAAKNGFEVLKWGVNNWEKTEAEGMGLSVGLNGEVWTINSLSEIFRGAFK